MIPANSQSAFGELDIWLARAGRHEELYAKLGAHVVDGGVRFAVWAPNATYVSVVGDFNNWDVAADTLSPVDATGIWEGIALGAAVGDRYKFHLDGREKADPMAFQAEVPPKTASVVFRSEHVWQDARLARPATRTRTARPAHDDLRGACAVVAEGPRLARARGSAGALRPRPRLHACRAAAGDAPPVLGFLGLSGHRLLRDAVHPRVARRLSLLRRPPARQRDRCAARLGAGAFPARRMGARPVRRNRAV